MNTKILMASSALVMFLFGVLASFLPHEILNYIGASAAGLEPLIVQILGALYLAFAMMNWMAKSNLIGGIYSRPMAMGNVLHFTIGAIALVKGIPVGPGVTFLWISSAVYSLFAVLFGLVVFTHPAKKPD